MLFPVNLKWAARRTCVELSADRLVALLERIKWRVIHEWSEYGVPPQLLETLAAHVLEELSISVKLAAAADCDSGVVLQLVLAHELGGELQELREELRAYRDSGCREALLAKLSHELALVLQAKRYLRMGFKVEDALKRHVEEALKIAAGIAEGGLAQLAHELLTS